jgi:hypothetical protein
LVYYYKGKFMSVQAIRAPGNPEQLERRFGKMV